MERFFVLLALAPLAEEAVFRRGLQEEMLRRGWLPAASIALTALAFAALHVAMWGAAAGWWVALPALLVGMLYARTRRLWPCVLLHAGLNAAGLALGLLQPPWPWVAA